MINRGAFNSLENQRSKANMPRKLSFIDRITRMEGDKVTMSIQGKGRSCVALLLVPLLMGAEYPVPANQPARLPEELASQATLKAMSRTGLQTIQVHVVGEITVPGTYMMSAPSRLTAALQAAGGVRTTGSNRRVAIRREGRAEQVVDLLLLNLQGNVSQDPYIFDNDVVFVPLKQTAVEIRGPVKRPGEYELIKEKSLGEVLALAGGCSNGVAKFRSIQIIRYSHDKNQKAVIEVPFEEKRIAETIVQDGDVIVLPHLFTANNPPVLNVGRLPNDTFNTVGFENRVFVVGGVKTPGAYPYNPQYRLPQYFALAGGGTLRTKSGVKITNADGRRIETTIHDSTVLINPGDTLDVGESQVSTEFWVGFMATLASVGLSAVAILRN